MPFDPFFIVLILFAVAVLWWMPRNARKQQATAMAFRDRLQPGQEVLTIGRMYGTVVEVDENRVTLELSDGVVGVWDKEGIMRLVDPPVPDDEALEDDELDDEEYEDEYDEELDDELTEDEVSIDDQIDEALLEDDGSADEVIVAETEEEWSEVDVPDDASSLIDPDEDQKKPR